MRKWKKKDQIESFATPTKEAAAANEKVYFTHFCMK